MRISHVVPFELDPFSGVYTAIANLAASLAKLGHEVVVWELSPWPAEASGLSELMESAGAIRRSIPSSSRPWALTDDAKKVLDRDLDADLVHLHSAFSPQNNLVARRLDGPLVLSPHGVFAAESLAHGRLKKLVFRRLFEMPTLRRVEALCALTEAERQEAIDFGYRGRIEVIPNGVDPPPLGVNTEALREELAIPPEDNLALFVGRLDLHHKRIDEVAEQIADTAGWHLAVVGPDYRGDEGRLQELVARLEGEERIHILGPRRGRALDETFAGADVFALLSRHEGMPMALLEALSHGLPAVVSPEVESTLPVAGAGAGWVTEVGGLGRFLGTIRTEDTRSSESQGARRLAATYRWESIAARYASLYEDVARAR